MAEQSSEEALEGELTSSQLPGLGGTRTFVVLALLFGIGFALFTPPLQAPDEGRHLMRAYLISTGELLVEPRPNGPAQGMVPTSLLEMGRKFSGRLFRQPDEKVSWNDLSAEFDRKLAVEQTTAIPLPSQYSPLPYLPQAFAMGLVRLLDAAPVYALYLGRVLNLLLFVGLVALALAMLPAHRLGFLLIATLPMTLFEAASLGADGITVALALLFVALVLREGSRAGPLANRAVIELVGVAILLCLSKVGYWPITGAVLLLPASRFPTPRRRLAVVGLVLAAGLLATGLWLAALTGIEQPPAVHGAIPSAQVSWILGHPTDAWGVLLRTMAEGGPGYVRTFIGQLGSLDVLLPASVYLGYPLLILFCALLDGGRRSPVRAGARGIALLLAAATFLSVMLLAYVGWNRVGSPLVQAVQGRYFIPFAPLLLIALHLPNRQDSAGPGLAMRALASLGSLTVLGIALSSLVARYYLP
ncbi:MAG: DUF2142 domain-containing protein [Deltaproteobacteria bacterium]|nr:DUF2142 domain-containing protein [Deltaproteobacteria bacterium]MBW2396876.1 DUF2142 domain-containing protein [Deltaproteobacteria bacterium]